MFLNKNVRQNYHVSQAHFVINESFKLLTTIMVAVYNVKGILKDQVLIMFLQPCDFLKISVITLILGSNKYQFKKNQSGETVVQ